MYLTIPTVTRFRMLNFEVITIYSDAKESEATWNAAQITTQLTYKPAN